MSIPTLAAVSLHVKALLEAQRVLGPFCPDLKIILGLAVAIATEHFGDDDWHIASRSAQFAPKTSIAVGARLGPDQAGDWDRDGGSNGLNLVSGPAAGRAHGS